MKWSVKSISFSAMMIAFSVILEMMSTFIPLFKMPNGGDVSLCAIPLLILGVVYGIKYSVVGGVLVAVIKCFFIPPYLFPSSNIFLVGLQFLLEYPFAYALMGFGVIFLSRKDKKLSIPKLTIGILFAMTLRYFTHAIAGIFFWSEIIGSIESILFSLSYNATYMVPMSIITAILTPIIIKTMGTSIEKLKTNSK